MSVEFPELRTKRLKLTRIDEKYLEDLFRVYANPRVVYYMDIEPMTSLEETHREWVEWSDDVYKKNKGIRFAIVLDGTLIGTCGFHGIDESPNGLIADIGYDLEPDYWRQGYMSEVLSEVINYGFEELDLVAIHGCVFEGNEPSVSLLERFGFEYTLDKPLDKPCKGIFDKEAVYVLTKDRWMDNK